VHDDADETLVGLQRYFDLAEFVVRIGVVEREPDEALDDGAQSALFLRRESRGRPEGRKERKDVRRRALVAQDADRHARHRKAILERPCSEGEALRPPSWLAFCTRWSAERIRSAAADEEGRERTILFNLSGHGHFDLAAYDNYLAGTLEDVALDEDEMSRALHAIEGLPSPA
jgi:hypothetical protein